MIIIVCSVITGIGAFGLGFIYHAMRWPLSEEASAVEAGIWRKRAHVAEAKLKMIGEASR